MKSSIRRLHSLSGNILLVSTATITIAHTTAASEGSRCAARAANARKEASSFSVGVVANTARSARVHTAYTLR
jgi:hypothetical protein